MLPLLPIAALLFAGPQVYAKTYQRVNQYAGSSFFDGWDYYGNIDDTTQGNVYYVSREQGTDASYPLTYINDAGNAVMRVDTRPIAPGSNRNSVRLSSQQTYGINSVWVIDALHVPFGCSVWPAFWSLSLADQWPAGGEIDTFEGVNLQTMNQQTLHTTQNCTLTRDPSTPFTGNVANTDCYAFANGNAGCGIRDSRTSSYGAGFAQSGGGVWVTELADEGVSVWFFNRDQIPKAISRGGKVLDTKKLPERTAFWPASTCDIRSHFNPQNLIFDITVGHTTLVCGSSPTLDSLRDRLCFQLCGQWAGIPSVLASTGCPLPNATTTCYDAFVQNGNFSDAYVSYFFVEGLLTRFVSHTDSILPPSNLLASFSSRSRMSTFLARIRSH